MPFLVCWKMLSNLCLCICCTYRTINVSRFGGLLRDSKNVNFIWHFVLLATARGFIFDEYMVCLNWILINVPYYFSCWLLFFRKTLNPFKGLALHGLFKITKLYSIVFNITKTCMGVVRIIFKKFRNTYLLLMGLLSNLYFLVLCLKDWILQNYNNS